MAVVKGEKEGNAGGWPAVVAQLLSILGGAARPAVIVAGLLTGLYFFVEQGNKIASESAKARQETEKLNAEKLKDADEKLTKAQAQLLETYTRFQDIGTKQVGNLKEVLDLRENVEKDRQKKVEEIKGFQEDKARLEAELERHKTEIERSASELDKKEKLLAKQGEELNAQQIRLKDAQLNYEQLARQREEAERSHAKAQGNCSARPDESTSGVRSAVAGRKAAIASDRCARIWAIATAGSAASPSTLRRPLHMHESDIEERPSAPEFRFEQESGQARSGLPLRPLSPLAGGSNPAGRASISAPRPPLSASRGGAALSMPRLSIGRPCNVAPLLAYCRFRRVKQGPHELAARVSLRA
jgi:hypothetical protein